MELPYTGDNAPPGSHRLPNKNPSAGYRLSPFLELLIRDVSEIPEIIQVIAIVFVCSLEHDGKILLLKKPHTLVIGHEEIELVLGSFLLPESLWSISEGYVGSWGGAGGVINSRIQD